MERKLKSNLKKKSCCCFNKWFKLNIQRDSSVQKYCKDFACVHGHVRTIKKLYLIDNPGLFFIINIINVLSLDVRFIFN